MIAILSRAERVRANPVSFSESNDAREIPPELYRTLTAHLPDVMVFLLDRELRILLADGEGWRRLPYFDETMFRGRRVEDLFEVPKETLDLAVENYRAAAAGERREFSFTDAGRTIEVVAAPVTGFGDGGVVVIARDVTEQAEARQVSLRARELYRTVASHIPDTAVGVLDEHLEWVLLEGDDVLSALGVTREAVINQKLGSVHGTLGEVARPLAERAIEGETSGTKWKSPADRWFSICVTPITSPEGDPHVLIAVRDFTTERAAEVALLEYQDAVHEYRMRPQTDR